MTVRYAQVFSFWSGGREGERELRLKTPTRGFAPLFHWKRQHRLPSSPATVSDESFPTSIRFSVTIIN